MTNGLSRGRRMVVIGRDGYRCRFCLRRVYDDAPATAREFLTIDHLWPRAVGGDDRVRNLVVACRDCNHRKGASDPTGEWAPLPVPEFPAEQLPYDPAAIKPPPPATIRRRVKLDPPKNVRQGRQEHDHSLARRRAQLAPSRLAQPLVPPDVALVLLDAAQREDLSFFDPPEVAS